MTHEEIVELLVREALEVPEEGWLSDLSSHDLRYDELNQSIVVDNDGSIDVGHIAGLILHYKPSE